MGTRGLANGRDSLMAIKRKIPAKAGQRDSARRRFMAAQGAKAAFGALLAFAFFGFVGRPDLAETGAVAVLLAPAPLTLLALTSIPLAKLESAALATFAALIFYLSVL